MQLNLYSLKIIHAHGLQTVQGKPVTRSVCVCPSIQRHPVHAVCVRPSGVVFGRLGQLFLISGRHRQGGPPGPHVGSRGWLCGQALSAWEALL